MLVQLLIWSILWGWRLLFDNKQTAVQDLAATLCFGLWETRALLWDLILASNLTSKLLPGVGSVGRVVAVSTLLLIVQCRRKRDHANGTSSTTKDIFVGRPLFFPSRTSHIRFFPKRHAFSYSYLFVGIPIGWRGCVNSMLSADTGFSGEIAKKRGWFDIDARKYLARGSSTGLQEKLRAYLNDQGLEASEYPFAYLVTAPAFLGYSFNPVSFWYLYTSQQKLGAILVEVNNTNDERHMYLLRLEPAEDGVDKNNLKMAAEDLDEAKGDMAEVKQHLSNNSLPQLTTPDKPLIFTNKWAKEFYVSPFNVQTGSYSIMAHDPLVQCGNKGPINTTLTLVSPEGRTLMVARVFSAGAAIDPALLTPLSSFAFISIWWWVGFVTFPRIVVEAAKLFFKKKLQFFSKPEIKLASVGRHETNTELILEPYFRGYLKSLVDHSTSPFELRYTAPVGAQVVRETFRSPGYVCCMTDGRRLDFDVRTPMFFSRFVHYDLQEHAFAQEAFCARHENRTLHVPNSELLKILTVSESKMRYEGKRGSNYQSSFDRWRWSILTSLRLPPAPPAYTEDTVQSFAQLATDLKVSSLSPLDEYVLNHCDTFEIRLYRRTVIEQFFAERIAFSDPAILHFYDLALRVLLIWMAVHWPFSAYAYGSNDPSTLRNLSQILIFNMSNVWALTKRLL